MIHATPESFYETYLRSPIWQAVRARILARDHHRCQSCGARRRLHIHHLTYARLGHEADRDLVTLCDPCHFRAHNTSRPAAHPGGMAIKRWPWMTVDEAEMLRALPADQAREMSNFIARQYHADRRFREKNIPSDHAGLDAITAPRRSASYGTGGGRRRRPTQLSGVRENS